MLSTPRIYVIIQLLNISLYARYYNKLWRGISIRYCRLQTLWWPVQAISWLQIYQSSKARA